MGIALVLFWYWQMLSSIAHSGLNIFLYFSPLWTIDDDIRRDQKSTKAIPNFLLSKRKLFLFRHFLFPLLSLSSAPIPTQVHAHFCSYFLQLMTEKILAWLFGIFVIHPWQMTLFRTHFFIHTFPWWWMAWSHQMQCDTS